MKNLLLFFLLFICVLNFNTCSVSNLKREEAKRSEVCQQQFLLESVDLCHKQKYCKLKFDKDHKEFVNKPSVTNPNGEENNKDSFFSFCAIQHYKGNSYCCGMKTKASADLFNVELTPKEEAALKKLGKGKPITSHNHKKNKGISKKPKKIPGKGNDKGDKIINSYGSSANDLISLSRKKAKKANMQHKSNSEKQAAALKNLKDLQQQKKELPKEK